MGGDTVYLREHLPLRRMALILLLLVFGVCNSGCSINGRGIGCSGEMYFENEARTGRSVTVDTWGLSVSTISGDVGVTLGRHRCTYYFAGPATTWHAADEVMPPLESVQSHVQESLRLKPVSAFSWVADTPVAMRGRNDGICIHSGMTGTGFTAGVQTFAALRLPAAINRLMWLKTNSVHPSDDVFHVKEINR